MPDLPSNQELKVLQDVEFLHTKNRLSEKIVSMLARIEETLRQEVRTSAFSFPAKTFLRSGKISKGENYQGLPYFILDYPRLFSKERTFAFRTMLWWGHEFSCTLHLSGDPLDKVKEELPGRVVSEKDLFFCVNKTPWEYHFEPSNYLPVHVLTKEKMKEQMTKTGFLKISNCVPLGDWEEFNSFTKTTFKRFLGFLY